MNPFTHARDHGFSHVVLSRATNLEPGQSDIPVIEAPVVAGRTVWEAVPVAADYLFVVEDPNHFGRREILPSPEARVLHMPVADSSSGAIRTTRHLAASLRQIRGLKLPHGEPEASWFAASLPFSAAKVVRALDEGGFPGCVALGPRYPEIPGGIRIAVAWSKRDNMRFCTIVRTAR
ncbi:MAG: hypothetical protein QNL12_01755 [Acidimicrobiia bacterium]|nr:hypothetical protein [Acidimicrobiia bacterium]